MTVTKSLEEWQKNKGDLQEELEEETEKIQTDLPTCQKCGVEVEENRIELTKITKNKRETRYYHLHCWMSLPRLKTFEISFSRPENATKNPKLDVVLDGQIFLPSDEIKKQILQLCYLLESEYQKKKEH